MNISEAQLIKQLLNRVQALEFRVAELEKPQESEPLDLVQIYSEMKTEKRKPGRPRKQQ